MKTLILTVLAAALIAPGGSFASGPLVANHGYTSADGHTYTKRIATSTATLSITGARFHAATYRGFATAVEVWVGVQDKADHWIQAGITTQPGWATPCVYLETDVPRYSLTCLRPAAIGEAVTFRFTHSHRWGWVAWVDGHPVGSARLGVLAAGAYATSERYGPATIRYTITPA